MWGELGAGIRIVLTAIRYFFEFGSWSTAALGMGYLIWLIFFGSLLTPLSVSTTAVHVDLLQTLAFLVALTALEITVVAASLSKLFQLAIENEVMGRIRERRVPGRRRPRVTEKSRSWFARIIDLRDWIWWAIALPNAILFLRQGLAEISLDSQSEGPTLLSIEGWLALAFVVSWVILVSGLTIWTMYLFGEINRAVKLHTADGDPGTH